MQVPGSDARQDDRVVSRFRPRTGQVAASARRVVLRNALSGAIALAAIATLPALVDHAARAQGTTATSETNAATATDFTLRDLDGKEHRLGSYLDQGKTVVLEWFNPDCPFVKKHHQTFSTMRDLEKSYRGRNVVWLAVNSGGPGLQGHGLERNRTARKEYTIGYPVLLDESGEVGRTYGAKTTPHMYVIAPDRKILYQGAIDSEKNPAKLGEVNYVRSALDAALAGKAVTPAQTAPYGCSVKYAAR